MRKLWSTPVAACLVALLVSPALAADDETITLRLATVAPEGSAPAKVIKNVARQVETKTHGRVKLKIYYGGADTVVCMAHGHLSELLRFVRS